MEETPKELIAERRGYQHFEQAYGQQGGGSVKIEDGCAYCGQGFSVEFSNKDFGNIAERRHNAFIEAHAPCRKPATTEPARHPDCYQLGGCGCGSIRLDAKPKGE